VGEANSASRLSHENSIECVAVGSEGGVVLSGDWDGRLCVWRPGSGAQVGEESTGLKKRRVGSGAAASLESLVPSAAFKAHAQCVSGVALTSRGDGLAAVAVTASWDHSVKVWDIERQDCVSTINGSKVGLGSARSTPLQCDLNCQPLHRVLSGEHVHGFWL
jgi:WD40 repeat protein